MTEPMLDRPWKGVPISVGYYLYNVDTPGIKAFLDGLTRPHIVVSITNLSQEARRQYIIEAGFKLAHKFSNPIHDSTLSLLVQRLKTAPGKEKL